MSKAVELSTIPKDKDYEDYVAAYLQAGGSYIERNIIHREIEELLELDIISTDFNRDATKKNLIEIKGGDWGFSDIFKIKGWLCYLNFKEATFIVQRTRPSISYFKEQAESLHINLIDNSNLNETHETLKELMKLAPDDNDIENIRFSYLLERKQLQKIKTFKKKYPEIVSYAQLDDYFFKVNCNSFFSNDPIKRINKLFRVYTKYKNISAKICHELEGGSIDGNTLQLTGKCYKETFYEAKDNMIHVALYVEHITRVTILKCAIEHLIDKLGGNYEQHNFDEQLEFSKLPRTIKDGLNQIIKDKHFHLYPCFWQFFTYSFGGFILTDIKDREYKILSEKTGIPINEIPNAFEAFNKLFPRPDGWFKKIPSSSIEWHSLFPITFCGIGANYRKTIYTDDDSYNSLAKLLSTDKTMSDISKWNNLTYNVLSNK